MITKLNNRELFQFCEQFSIILRSGMSAIEGLAILNDDSQTERGKEILTFLYKDMEESGSLAHAMEQSGAFPASAAAYVRTGEETGCLDEVMKGLSAFYAKDFAAISKNALPADLPTSAIFFPSAEPAIAGTADPRIIAPQRSALTIFLFMFFSSHGII